MDPGNVARFVFGFFLTIVRWGKLEILSQIYVNTYKITINILLMFSRQSFWNEGRLEACRLIRNYNNFLAVRSENKVYD